MSPQNADKWLKWLLRLDGLIMITAIFPVWMPDGWIEQIHDSLGLGDWPAASISVYLARSCSLLYAIHGCLVLALSFDVVKYRELVRLVLWLHLLLGATLLWIDIQSGMPDWWTVFEGPGIAGFAVLMLTLMRHSAKAQDHPDKRSSGAADN